MRADRADPAAILAPYWISDRPAVLAIGTFDDRVTVLSQQRRALNLAWALIEAKKVPTARDNKTINIAVIGAGFAGLTFAASLISKKVDCKIDLFEERDTLLPLQQGSDTRWVHPNIYDWPSEGSEPQVATLPVLNWKAARASDVVVQVLIAWKEIVDQLPSKDRLNLWCNTRHVQLRGTSTTKSQLEWVGERRRPESGQSSANGRGAEGNSAEFDLVILAVGFGLEVKVGSSSYWRNEILGQPQLGRQRTQYMVSGQGDGAMIDLLRLKISQFRQDRILAELFSSKECLVGQLKILRTEFMAPGADFSLFNKFEELAKNSDLAGEQIRAAISELSLRLRRDTEIILQLRSSVRSLADLFQAGSCRTSFQNALLVYLLYRCGGFAPASGEPKDVRKRFVIPETNVIWRHGTDRLDVLERLLPASIATVLRDAWKNDKGSSYRQTAEVVWSGGYFGTEGREEDFGTIHDDQRATWRKEYLPGPTSLLGSSVVGAVAGHLWTIRPAARHFRVTLHRVMTVHTETLLQQICGYAGMMSAETRRTAGRTYPVTVATIGLAYRTRAIVRSRADVDPEDLDLAMGHLSLNQASRKMAADVRFLAAIPILQPDDKFISPSPVCAVLYLDSQDKNFKLTDDELLSLSTLTGVTLNTIQQAGALRLDGIENAAVEPISSDAPVADTLPSTVIGALQLLRIDVPHLARPFSLNYDHSDLPLAAHSPTAPEAPTSGGA